MKAKLSLLALALFQSIPVSAQIPVTDGAHIIETVVGHAETMIEYGKQIAEMKRQLTQAKEQFDSLNGLRDIGGLLKDELLRQTLPPDLRQAMEQLQRGQGGPLSGGISGSLAEITKKNQAHPCSSYKAVSVQKECERAWQTQSMDHYVGDVGYKQAADNIKNLEKFVDSIKNSKDPKSLQDLQARINVEQVRIQNEQVKLQAISMMQKSREDIQRRNSIDNTVKSLKPGFIRMK